jgi:5'-3' exonuclease
MHFEQDMLFSCIGTSPQKFDFDHFKTMCLLAGNDFLPNIKGIGFVRAMKAVKQLKSDNIDYVSSLDKNNKIHGCTFFFNSCHNIL